MDNQVAIDDEVWVFLSHSNKDYDAVRQLRNMLEEEGFRPIMFFLCCLNDDEEIGELIKREIDSRRLFILCNSPNARNSAWVQKEVDYIKSKRRYYQTIKLDAPLDSIRDQLHQFRRDSTVYLEYARKDHALSRQIMEVLRNEMGCKIYAHDLSETLIAGKLSLKGFIDKALKNGYLFFLLPDGNTESKFLRNELNYVLRHDLADRVCILTNDVPKVYSLLKEGGFSMDRLINVVDYQIHDGKVVFNEEELYLRVMLDRIKEGARLGEPAAQYWLAFYNFHYCVQFEYGLYADSFRRYTLNMAKSAADAGYAPAEQLFKEIYEDIMESYPEDFKNNSQLKGND